MYPQRELALVAARKNLLRKKIAQRRSQVADDFRRIAKPLAWLDRVVAWWRTIPTIAKLAAVPLGLVLMKRTFFRRQKMLAPLLRWLPVVYDAVQGMKTGAKEQSSKGAEGG